MTVVERSYLLRVREVVEETEDATSLVLEPEPEDRDAFTYRAGQFLTLAVPSERTGLVTRCYSLSSAPHEPGLRITVKRTAEGFASNWLCDNMAPGDRLRSLAPGGIFTPADPSADLLLFAAGSGITPVISIVKDALHTGSGRIVLFDANVDPTTVIFAEELADLARVHPDRLRVVHWWESGQGLPDVDQVRAFAEPYADHDAFVCGPKPFMQVVAKALKALGFPRERRHQEVFLSLSGNPFGESVGVPVS